MGTWFLESSAVVKRYCAEVGTIWLQQEIQTTLGTGTGLVIAQTTSVEVISAISRRERGGTVSSSDAATFRNQFRVDLVSDYRVVQLTDQLVQDAMQVAEVFALRGYDAVQLATAIQTNNALTANGEPPLTLMSADKELNTVALSSGLIVDDPNLHP